MKLLKLLIILLSFVSSIYAMYLADQYKIKDMEFKVESKFGKAKVLKIEREKKDLVMYLKIMNGINIIYKCTIDKDDINRYKEGKIVDIRYRANKVSDETVYEIQLRDGVNENIKNYQRYAMIGAILLVITAISVVLIAL